MNISLNYGQGTVNVNVPEKNYLGTLSPKDVEGAADPLAETRRAMANPIGSPLLRKMVQPLDQIVILASDISRPSPSYILLPPVLEELAAAGVKDEQITIVFGLGVHRKQTEEEKEKLVGADVYKRIRCIDHDVDQCVEVGVTRRGTPVSIFKPVLDADFIIATGNLEFHYFAGFSGGAKALAPGVCSRETIKYNHQRFIDPGARGGKIEGNPVREEIEEIGAMVGIDFMVNAILNSHKKVVKVVAGDVTAAHREGTRYIKEMFSMQIDELADIVITTPGGFPKDIDLYQTHKAMENASMAVKNGGILIVIAECKDGLGEGHFGDALKGDLTPQELIDELKTQFILGRHKASRIASINLNSEIYFVSSLPEEVKAKLFLRQFGTPDEALEKALEVQGEDAKVLVIPYGISTLPSLKE